MRKLCQYVGRRRSNHQRLRPLRLANVFNAVLLGRRLARARGSFVPKARDHFVPGQRSERERLNKFASRLRHYHVHFQCLALQSAHQFRRLVRSNSAGDAHRHSHGSIVEQEQ